MNSPETYSRRSKPPFCPPERLSVKSIAPRPKLDELLAWYLSRQSPGLGLWRYKQGEEVHSDTVHLGKQIEIEYLEYPSDAQGYLNWIRNFCRKKKIRYTAPAKTLSWWSERQWLIVSSRAGHRDSHSLENDEVVSDLASFFALKATQLQQCLGSEGWVSWEFPAEAGATKIQPVGDDHTLYVREGPTEGSLSKDTMLLLEELGVVSTDA